jgi:hypothetical protein
MQEWYRQLELERELTLQEALIRAERKEATEDDWKVIYFECGMKRSKNESDGFRA